MISRVAESCFWLHRYVERAESMARLLRVNRAFLLDINLPQFARWRPVVVVAGEEEDFVAMHGEATGDDAEAVQAYLTWDEISTVSIVSSIRWARENARTIREIISKEMWEALNTTWHWLTRGQGRKAYGSDRDAFYERVQALVGQFHGVCQNTMLHDEAFDFMRLGMFLERAGQTARIMDMKYHLIGPTSNTSRETPLEAAQWRALLRSCSGEDCFLRAHPQGLCGRDVIDFLLKDKRFPRAIMHCLERALNFSGRIQQSAEISAKSSHHRLKELTSGLQQRATSDILGRGLHHELTWLVDEIAAVCDAIHADYFESTLPEQLGSHWGGEEVTQAHE